MLTATFIPTTLEQSQDLDFSLMPTDNIVGYLQMLYNTHFEDREALNNTRELIKSECLARIQNILRVGIDYTNIHDLLNLVRSYAATICGYIVEPSFNGPTHIFRNEELVYYITTYFDVDNTPNHNLSNVNPIIDYVYLYSRRITETN